jgi:hypothetical protein
MKPAGKQVLAAKGHALAHMAPAAPKAAQPLPLLAAGNQAVQALFRAGTLRAKLELGSPDDPEEREADAMAERVMRSADGPGGAPFEGDAGATVRRQPAGAAALRSLPAGLESEIRGLTRGGMPLSSELRGFFEPRLGRDLGAVRLHNGPEAASTARALGARAYTVGDHVGFAPGQFAPGTTQGRHLLAHELAHVAQQDATPSSANRSGPGASAANAPTAASPTVRRQLVTPLAPGGGFGGLLDRDRRNLTDEPKRPPGTEHSAPLGDVVVSLPNYEFMKFRGIDKRYEKSTGDVVFGAAVIPIPEMPIFVDIYGKGELAGALSAGLGPGMLEQIKVGMGYATAATALFNPLTALALGRFKGRASLSIPAHLRASLSLSGLIGASATAAVIKVARLEGGLSGEAALGANLFFGSTVELIYDNGVLSFSFSDDITLDTYLTLTLAAFLRASVLGFTWKKNWPLTDWRRVWRMALHFELSYINGIRDLSVQAAPEELDLTNAVRSILDTAKAIDEVARIAQGAATDPESPLAGAATAPGEAGEADRIAEAGKTVVGNLLDIAHSGYATGWAGKAAGVTQVHPTPPSPLVPYINHVGRRRRSGSLIGGFTATEVKADFRDYGRRWRRQQSIPQRHHIATDKREAGIYDFSSHEAFGAKGISIQDPANLIWLHGHSGPHEANYHAEVLVALDRAVGIASGRGAVSYQTEVIAALEGLRNRILDGTLRLYADKEVWD